MKRWHSWRPVTAFTSGLGDIGVPMHHKNHGRGENVHCFVVKFVVLAGHVVTNSARGDLLYRGHPTPQQIFFIFFGKDKPSSASSE